MKAAAEEYFKSCEGRALKDEDGNIIKDKNGMPVMVGKKPVTVTGLCLALGFLQRKSLIDYSRSERFAPVVMEAKLRCQQYAEERLYDKEGHAGAKFTLQNNFGWGEEKEVKEEETEDSGTDADAALRALGYVRIEDK